MATQAFVGSFNTGTGAVSTTVPVTGVGFTPKIAFFWWSNRTGTVDASGRGDFDRGFGCAISTTDRRCVTGGGVDNNTVTGTRCMQSNVACVGVVSNVVDGLLDFSTWDADGFTLIVDDQFTASYRIHYLALGGGDITNLAGGSFTKPTSVGAQSQSTTGVGFQPDVVLFMATQQITNDSSVSNESICTLGVAKDSTAMGVNGAQTRFGAAGRPAAAFVLCLLPRPPP